MLAGADEEVATSQRCFGFVPLDLPPLDATMPRTSDEVGAREPRQSQMDVGFAVKVSVWGGVRCGEWNDGLGVKALSSCKVETKREQRRCVCDEHNRGAWREGRAEGGG